MYNNTNTRTTGRLRPGLPLPPRRRARRRERVRAVSFWRPSPVDVYTILLSSYKRRMARSSILRTTHPQTKTNTQPTTHPPLYLPHPTPKVRQRPPRLLLPARLLGGARALSRGPQGPPQAEGGHPGAPPRGFLGRAGTDLVFMRVGLFLGRWGVGVGWVIDGSFGVYRGEGRGGEIGFAVWLYLSVCD